MRKFLRKSKRLLDRLLGTRADEWYWRLRYAIGREDEGMSIDHPHRVLLCETVLKYAPLSSVLEIGCGWGPNLLLLAEEFPRASLVGMDISASAVRKGKRIAWERRALNVDLRKGKADRLQGIADKSMDVVVSDAALLYVGPDKIVQAFSEMVRVCRKAIVLCEQHTEGEPEYRDLWIHNYRELVHRFAPGSPIRFQKIPEEIWGGGWGQCGYIIEILREEEA